MKNMVSFDYEDGITMCTIKDKDKQYRGLAICHPDDKEFESERVGCAIAEQRAIIAALTSIRDNEIKPQYKVIKHLYTNISSSKKHDAKNYESKMLKRAFYMLKKELEEIEQTIKGMKTNLRVYIKARDEKNEMMKSLNNGDLASID